MSCKCCVSLRGLAYFSASAHIIVGTKYLVEFIESLFSISQSKLILTETINIVTERLVYRWVFLSLGLLIFQGIDRESKTLLKRSSIIFLVLQALTLAVRLKYGYMYSSMSSSSSSSNTFWDSKSEPNPEIYRGLSWGFVATVAYLMILFLYVRKLEMSIYGGRLLHPNTTATHIPLSTTNLGWYGQSHTSRGSRGHSGNSSGASGALYSPLNFFGGVVGGGFNPLVWTNPGPPPPYTDSAPSSETPSSRSMPPPHPHHNIQPCSSRMMMSMSSVTSNDSNSDKILNTSSRTSDRNERGGGDPSAAVPLLDEESDDKNGLEC